MVFSMAIQSVTCLVRIAPRTIDVRATYIDRTSRRKLEGRGLQVTEVGIPTTTICQLRGTMAG